MKAAVVLEAGATPVYRDFPEPEAAPGKLRITVHAAALTHLSKGRASGTHYSSSGAFPSVPGVDGVGTTEEGQRVYFVLPEPPFGALGEQTLVDAARCVPLPEGIGDVDAAAIANPGMSAWASLVERAQLRAGETVLVHGATGTAGRVAVQLAKHLGAAKVIATGRNAAELEDLKEIGADEVVAFAAGADGANQFEASLVPLFAERIDVVIDYLWGETALAIILAIAKAVEEGHPVRFVHVGAAAGEPDIPLPGAALRSSAIELMGSGLKSVSMPKLLEAIRHCFELCAAGKLSVASVTLPIAEVEATWANAGGKPRVVFTLH